MAHHPKPRKTCTVSGCDRTHAAHGLCRAHYSRSKRNRPVDSPIHASMHRKPAHVLTTGEKRYAPTGYMTLAFKPTALDALVTLMNKAEEALKQDVTRLYIEENKSLSHPDVEAVMEAIGMCYLVREQVANARGGSDEGK